MNTSSNSKVNNSQYSIYTTIVNPTPDKNDFYHMTCISVLPFDTTIIKYMDTNISSSRNCKYQNIFQMRLNIKN